MHNGEEMILKNVRFIPELKRNLISLGVLDELGYSIKVETGILKILKGSFVLMKGVRKNGIYSLLGNTVIGSVSIVTENSMEKGTILHQRLGHVSEKGLIELSKQGLISGDNIKNIEFCETCIYGKACKVKFGIGQRNTKGALDYIHSDLWGPQRLHLMLEAGIFYP
ncbi:hypothetical protein BUALT_Bualt09G0056100 [Buddleja alternifolia]|uniref:GAG-pre-integrase domain-containing protein n=1 Tax=Buddleja alternifolia TaxID=168488 RepID=A0AAV6X0U4_9LAMI|nr:hypothetical protein BUALT_Bualt09G0056100 [Buddleja alternifolia]